MAFYPISQGAMTFASTSAPASLLNYKPLPVTAAGRASSSVVPRLFWPGWTATVDGHDGWLGRTTRVDGQGSFEIMRRAADLKADALALAVALSW